MFKDNKTGEEFAGTSNVWLKRLGLVILIIGIFPAVASNNPGIFIIIIFLVLLFALITYGISFLKDFFKSFFK